MDNLKLELDVVTISTPCPLIYFYVQVCISRLVKHNTYDVKLLICMRMYALLIHIIYDVKLQRNNTKLTNNKRYNMVFLWHGCTSRS